MKGSEDDASMESESSSDSSSSSSSVSNSQDDSSDLLSAEAEDAAMEGGEDEMSEGVLGDQEEVKNQEQQESGNNSSEESSDESEEVGVALGRERRQAKPNMMDDHIYFVKKSKREDCQYFVKKRQDTDFEPQLTKSQLLAKRQAKLAAKQFERQKQKTIKEVNKPPTSLDFTTIQPSEDAELMDSITQMRQKIRNQFVAKITTCLEGHTCFGEKGSSTFIQSIKAIALELEDMVATKYPLVDN